MPSTWRERYLDAGKLVHSNSFAQIVATTLASKSSWRRRIKLKTTLSFVPVTTTSLFRKVKANDAFIRARHVNKPFRKEKATIARSLSQKSNKSPDVAVGCDENIRINNIPKDETSKSKVQLFIAETSSSSVYKRRSRIALYIRTVRSRKRSTGSRWLNRRPLLQRMSVHLLLCDCSQFRYHPFSRHSHEDFDRSIAFDIYVMDLFVLDDDDDAI